MARPYFLNPLNQEALTPVAAAVEQQAVLQERARLERLKRAWRYYEGDHDRPLLVKPGAADDNTLVNKCRTTVDIGASFLFGGEGVTFATGTEEETGAEDEYLAEVWEQNRKSQFLHRLAINGGVCGHAFIKVTIDPEYEYPRFILLDPQTVVPLYEVDDYERVYQYRIQWHGIDPRTGKAVARRQLITRLPANWLLVDEIARREGRWEEMGRQTWPYPWEPIFHCQNLPLPNAFWGLSDLETDILHLNDRLNAKYSDMAKVLRYWGFPFLWGKGFNASGMDRSVDNFVTIPSEQGSIQAVEMQSDLTSGLNYIKALADAFHEASRVPEVTTGRTEDLGALSGIALKLLYGPLLEKTETKQLLYGDMLNALNRRLLELGGFADKPVKCNWPDNLPVDPKSEAETAQLLDTLGVSRETLLRQLGFDPEAETPKREEEDRARQATQAELGDRLLTQFERGQ